MCLWRLGGGGGVRVLKAASANVLKQNSFSSFSSFCCAPAFSPSHGMCIKCKQRANKIFKTIIIALDKGGGGGPHF